MSSPWWTIARGLSFSRQPVSLRLQRRERGPGPGPQVDGERGDPGQRKSRRQQAGAGSRGSSRCGATRVQPRPRRPETMPAHRAGPPSRCRPGYRPGPIGASEARGCSRLQAGSAAPLHTPSRTRPNPGRSRTGRQRGDRSPAPHHPAASRCTSSVAIRPPRHDTTTPASTNECNGPPISATSRIASGSSGKNPRVLGA